MYNAVSSSILYTRSKDASMTVEMSLFGPSGQLSLESGLRQALGTIAHFQALGDINLQKTSVSRLLHVDRAYRCLKTQQGARMQCEKAGLATGSPVDEDEGIRGSTIVNEIIG
jgi:hypothetical protein